MKDAPGFRVYPILLIALLLACTVFLASCFGDSSSNSSPASPASNTITPVGAPTTCLTVNSPSLLKLADRFYQLVDVIDHLAHVVGVVGVLIGRPVHARPVVVDADQSHIEPCVAGHLPQRGESMY